MRMTNTAKAPVAGVQMAPATIIDPVGVLTP